MTLLELLIVYLAVGAPFGVLFYLEHQSRMRLPSLVARSFVAALLWSFAVARLTLDRVFSPGKIKTFLRFAEGDGSDQRVETSFERELCDSLAELRQTADAVSARQLPGVVEFREVLERYTGLTRALRNAAHDNAPTAAELEFCRMGGGKPAQILRAALCLHRRNIARLKTHAVNSQRDFLRILEKINSLAAVDFKGDKTRKPLAADYFFGRALGLAHALDDSATIAAVRAMLDDNRKTPATHNIAGENGAPVINHANGINERRERWRAAATSTVEL